MIYLAIGAVLLAFLVGAAGMRAAGRAVGRLWRPGSGLLAVVLLTGAGILAVREAWAPAAGLFMLGAGLALTARRTPLRPRGPAPPSRALDEAEARSILGVGPEAGEAEIQAAYVRLMKRVHPDVGGAPGLAAQLNAARARLLGRR